MRILDIVPAPAPSAFPEMDMGDMVALTAKAHPKRGDSFYLCNPMDQLIDARESGEPFIAHAVIGMMPKRVIIEPGTLDRIEEV